MSNWYYLIVSVNFELIYILLMCSYTAVIFGLQMDNTKMAIGINSC